MTEPELTPLTLDDTFEFACHCNVPCFNHCCRDLNQALTPYDVLRLKKNLGITTRTFLAHYATIQVGPATGLPVVSLRFSSDKGSRKNKFAILGVEAPVRQGAKTQEYLDIPSFRNAAGRDASASKMRSYFCASPKHGQCPFVTPEGCRVYVDRPASCRIYPLVRVLRRSRTDGSLIEQFALLREPHCQGFEQGQRQSVGQWIDSQLLDTYHEANDALLELIALKNQLRPGPLPRELQQLVQMAFYDLETLKQRAADEQLEAMHSPHLRPIPESQDDQAWLKWSMDWIVIALFGPRGLRSD